MKNKGPMTKPESVAPDDLCVAYSKNAPGTRTIRLIGPEKINHLRCNFIV
jgi:hypothetical protein